jgi:hypothetical protein
LLTSWPKLSLPRRQANRLSRRLHFRDFVVEDDVGVSIGTRINADSHALRSEIIDEVDKAWAGAPAYKHASLSRSPVEHHGEDRLGWAILIMAGWLTRKAGLLS